MNSKLSLGLFLISLDTAARLAGYRGIANRALGQAIGAAQRVVRGQDDRNNQFGTGTLDARNTQDIETQQHNGYADAEGNDPRGDAARTIDPPVGLKNQPTPEEQLDTYARIYAAALAKCQELAQNQYDLPQGLSDRIDFIVSRAREALMTRPRQFNSEAEKIAFAAKVGQAKNDHEFWTNYRTDVQALVENAIDNAGTDDEVLDTLEGVEAHQYAIHAGVGVGQTMARCKLALERFGTGTIIGRMLASDFGALEAELPRMKAFIDELEMAYSSVILSAVHSGRNLLSTEAVDEAYGKSIDRAVDRAIQTQDAAAKTLA